ncbi:MAG: hypothetical protein NZ480_08365 [Bdellovibrionaceae bacterium]|nr:hypothetical protein [Pseudobdellovibrionaceae bacterium]MDW8190351.1 hypothetical protein [Pseudobdellovibrionaceae bacterium]
MNKWISSQIKMFHRFQFPIETLSTIAVIYLLVALSGCNNSVPGHFTSYTEQKEGSSDSQSLQTREEQTNHILPPGFGIIPNPNNRNPNNSSQGPNQSGNSNSNNSQNPGQMPPPNTTPGTPTNPGIKEALNGVWYLESIYCFDSTLSQVISFGQLSADSSFWIFQFNSGKLTTRVYANNCSILYQERTANATWTQIYRDDLKKGSIQLGATVGKTEGANLCSAVIRPNPPANQPKILTGDNSDTLRITVSNNSSFDPTQTEFWWLRVNESNYFALPAAFRVQNQNNSQCFYFFKQAL